MTRRVRPTLHPHSAEHHPKVKRTGPSVSLADDRAGSQPEERITRCRAGQPVQRLRPDRWHNQPEWHLKRGQRHPRQLAAGTDGLSDLTWHLRSVCGATGLRLGLLLWLLCTNSPPWPVLGAYVQTVKTASGATAVQIVHANRRGSREIENVGSGHTPAEVEVLRTVARQRLHANQDMFDFDDGQPDEEEAPIVSSQARHLWELLTTAYQVLRFDRACQGDEVFGLLTLARVVSRPASWTRSGC